MREPQEARQVYSAKGDTKLGEVHEKKSKRAYRAVAGT